LFDWFDLAVLDQKLQSSTFMAHSSRICLTSRGSTIDALGGGQYRVCDQSRSCTVTEGLWAAYESLRELEQKRTQ
jgi:hypothetical protein